MYPINELFETIQGEGQYTGVPAIFLRLQGCPVACPWCDTQQTWELDQDNMIPIKQIVEKNSDTPTWQYQSENEIVQLFDNLDYTAKHVVITGGEPCMYDLLPLSELLHSKGYSTQIETSGTFEVKTSTATWVTVSPKVAMKGGFEVLKSALLRADEIKHPVATEHHIEELHLLLADLPKKYHKRVCLQPISQKSRATELAIKTCIKNNWRLSIQTHKYLDIA